MLPSNFYYSSSMEIEKIDKLDQSKYIQIQSSFCESDGQFLAEVQAICEKKRSSMKSFFDKSDISDDMCDKIAEYAKIHAQANTFNSNSMVPYVKLRNKSNVKCCACGCKKGTGENLPLCMNEQNLTFLGPGVLLFFFYMKHMRLMVLLLLVGFSFYSIISSILSPTEINLDTCITKTEGIQKVLCQYNSISTFNLKTSSFLRHFQLWTGMFFFIFWTLGIKFIGYLGQSKNQQIDNLLDSASDYTIRIQNLPFSKTNQSQLIQFVEQLWKTRQTMTIQNRQQLINSDTQEPLDLKSIQIIYNMSDCRKLISSLQDKCLQMEDFLRSIQQDFGIQANLQMNNDKFSQKQEEQQNNTNNSGFFNSSYIETKPKNMEKKDNKPIFINTNIPNHNVDNDEIIHSGSISQIKKIPGEHVAEYKSRKKQIQKYHEELNKLRQKFMNDMEYRRSMSTTCALIEFRSSDQQSEFLHYYENTSMNALASICQSKMKIEFKGEELIFSRAPQPSDFNWSNCEIKFSYLRYSIIWAITMLILYTAYALVSYTQTLSMVKTSAGALTSIIIQVFNRIIWISLSFLVTYEYQNTKTDSIISLMKKSIFAQVMNVVMAPMISKFLNNKPLYGENSVSSGSILYQFIMFFMMFIFYVANPMYYAKLIIISCKGLRNRMMMYLCQIVGEVDTIDEIRPVITYYEGPDFPIAGGYVYMTTAIIHTMFYCHLQPILFLILIFNMTGFYFIMKYLLLRRCKIPDLTDFRIYQCAISSVSYGTLFYCLGSMLFIILQSYQFDRALKPAELIPSAICLVLWIIISMNPFQMTTRFNQFLFQAISFSQDFVKASEVNKNIQGSAKNVKIEDIFADMIMNSVENQKMLYQRKQSYYKNCNVHKLFNFQAELRQLKNKQTVKRAHEVQKFCEGFFKGGNNEDQNNCMEEQEEEDKKVQFKDIFDAILIPAIQIKKDPTQKQKQDNSRQTCKIQEFATKKQCQQQQQKQQNDAMNNLFNKFLNKQPKSISTNPSKSIKKSEKKIKNMVIKHNKQEQFCNSIFGIRTSQQNENTITQKNDEQ